MECTALTVLNVSRNLYIYLSLVSTNIDKVLEKREVDEADDDSLDYDEEFDPIINKGFCKSKF